MLTVLLQSHCAVLTVLLQSHCAVLTVLLQSHCAVLTVLCCIGWLSQKVRPVPKWKSADPRTVFRVLPLASTCCVLATHLLVAYLVHLPALL